MEANYEKLTKKNFGILQDTFSNKSILQFCILGCNNITMRYLNLATTKIEYLYEGNIRVYSRSKDKRSIYFHIKPEVCLLDKILVRKDDFYSCMSRDGKISKCNASNIKVDDCFYIPANYKSTKYEEMFSRLCLCNGYIYRSSDGNKYIPCTVMRLEDPVFVIEDHIPNTAKNKLCKKVIVTDIKKTYESYQELQEGNPITALIDNLHV